MLKIENIDELYGEGFVTDVNTIRKYWSITNVEKYAGTYDIRLERKISIMESEFLTIMISRERSDRMVAKGYQVQIIKEGTIIDRDQIRFDNIKTMSGMLTELRTIIEMMQ
jgi:hypothetical protein